MSRDSTEWALPSGAWSSGCCRLPSTQTPRCAGAEWWGRCETAALSTVSGSGGRCGGGAIGGETGLEPLLTGRILCFPTHPGHHEWLLGPKVDILPFLLLPLAGPEDFSEEEMEREWLGWRLRAGRAGEESSSGRQGSVQTRALPETF